MSNLAKKLIFLFAATAFVLSPVNAFAHVAVKPSEVKVAERLNFTVGVPTEKEVPTTGLRLVIPEGLDNVRPLVKPGWEINIVKSSEQKITEIIWTKGTIPANQKDEFVFSAKVPANETTLIWRAYQTYADGTVVSWDAAEEVEGEEDKGPYSETKVIDDVTVEAPVVHSESQGIHTASLVALALATVSLLLHFRKK